MKSKKTVFLTGATGTMGHAGLVELSKRLDRFNITLLARPSKINKEKLAAYEAMAGIRIVWGDLTNYQDVLNGVMGADYVLHVGGMVSPAADYFPKKTLKVNTTAAQYIVDAVKAQPNSDRIKVVYIGSVAQTGHRNAPVHWGRTGDPINISVYDHYAISKTIAERIFVESGIKHWACLRQTGILCPELLFKGSDPITFHVPLDGVLEWATAEDSGRLLANVCEEEVPDEFWNRFYNISSGPSFRLTNYEFECKLLKAIGCPAPEKIFEPNWFAIRNFHGQWYTDSDLLEGYLHFRSNQTCDDYFKWMASQVPWYFHLAKIVPPIFIKSRDWEPVTGSRTDTKIVYPPILARMRIGKQSRVGIRSGQNAPPKHPSFWIMVMMKVSRSRNGISRICVKPQNSGEENACPRP